MADRSPDAPPPPGGILETCIYVSDMEVAQDFYTKFFGFEVMESDERFCAFNMGPERVLLLFLRDSAPEGNTLPFGHIPPHNASGSIHLGFRIPEDSLEEWKHRLEDFGISIESEFTWPRGGTSLYFRDPDDNLLELLTPGVWPNY